MSISISIDIHINISIYVYVHIYIYMYIYMYRRCWRARVACAHGRARQASMCDWQCPLLHRPLRSRPSPMVPLRARHACVRVRVLLNCGFLVGLCHTAIVRHAARSSLHPVRMHPCACIRACARSMAPSLRREFACAVRAHVCRSAGSAWPITRAIVHRVPFRRVQQQRLPVRLVEDRP